ncbi:MAG: hypothetical protein HY816_05625 [Candidatus Wallbacteria bacterium]|nr:hypothetical protein [Candidatus Wallbacteria bacterium]
MKVDPGSLPEAGTLAFQLLGLVVAAVLRQRGHLIIHGAAAAAQGRALLVMGDSGAGKSTTLHTLLARGYAMLSDNFTALRRRPDGALEVLPGVPRMSLTRDSARRLGTDLSHHPKHPNAPQKNMLPTGTRMAPEPVELALVCQLRSGQGDRLLVRAVEGSDKFVALTRCLYVGGVQHDPRVTMDMLAAAAGQSSFIQIERPSGRWCPDDIVEVLLREMAKPGAGAARPAGEKSTPPGNSG